jgi:hypothetical protein
MKTSIGASISGRYPSIVTVMTALVIACVAVACAMFVVVSGIPGLAG